MTTILPSEWMYDKAHRVIQVGVYHNPEQCRIRDSGRHHYPVIERVGPVYVVSQPIQGQAMDPIRDAIKYCKWDIIIGQY